MAWKIIEEAKIITSKNVRNILKSKIKGEVHCHVADDTLIVDIYAVNSIVFKYTLHGLAGEIVQGKSSDELARMIFKRYKQYIENLLFL